MPKGLTWKTVNGGRAKGPIIIVLRKTRQQIGAMSGILRENLYAWVEPISKPIDYEFHILSIRVMSQGRNEGALLDGCSEVSF